MWSALHLLHFSISIRSMTNSLNSILILKDGYKFYKIIIIIREILLRIIYLWSRSTYPSFVILEQFITLDQIFSHMNRLSSILSHCLSIILVFSSDILEKSPALNVSEKGGKRMESVVVNFRFFFFFFYNLMSDRFSLSSDSFVSMACLI